MFKAGFSNFALYLLCMSNTENYRVVKSLTEGLYKEKGSRFLAFVIPCESAETAKQHIDLLWKKHPGAVHVCYAWRFGKARFQDRFSDDGEPSNTAGKPIHGQIIAHGITNVLIAVVRYYGGTNLGAGGLMHAYKAASQDALSHAVFEEHYLADYFTISHSYYQTTEVMNMLQKVQADIISRNFDHEEPQLHFKVRQNRSEQLTLALGSKYKLIQTATDQ